MNHIEAWKGVVDFTKTVMSLAAGLLAAFVTFFVVNGRQLVGWEYLSPGLLIASVLLSLYGFGQALSALKSGTSSWPSILFSNAGAVALVVAICALPFTLRPRTGSIDEALAKVESETKMFPVDLAAKNCRAIERRGESLVLSYEAMGKLASVTYSLTAGRVESIK
jgi:hypothetical protein